MAQILDGKIVQGTVKTRLEEEIKALALKPKLVILQIGDLPSSNTYIKKKKLFGESVGTIVWHKQYREDVEEEELLRDIEGFNNDPNVHGIILQIPIPEHFNKHALLEAIKPEKDVDGLGSVNFKLLSENDPKGFMPATTKGILSLLDHYKIEVKGKKVTVVGRSALVGKPTALALLNRDATVTVCHSQTADLREETKKADILVVAAGKPKFITADFVKSGEIIIDVGINVGVTKLQEETGDSKIVGDVDFETVKDIVAGISPVPGGVGPMTVASLFENLLKAYKNQK